MEDIPKPYYPDEWRDDETMDVLFSPFRDSRDINPQSWDKKMKFWKEVIMKEIDFSKSPVIDIKQLPHRFRRKGKIPVCLENVLKEMVREKKLQSLSEYESSLNIGWVGWGYGMLVKKPVSWTFSKLLGYGAPQLDGEYISVDSLKVMSNKLLLYHQNHAGEDKATDVVEYDTFRHKVSHLCRDEQAFSLALRQLCYEKKASVVSNEHGDKLIRFQSKDKKSVKPVSEIDMKVLELKKSEEYLKKQVLQLSEEMERCKADARFYLNKGLKNSAKNALRRKKTLERMMEKREGAIDTVNMMRQQLRDAESNKVILDAYRDGASAFKDMSAAYNLTPENIDNVMTDIHEVFDLQSEIDASIAQGPASPLEESKEQLEAELDDLLSEDFDHQGELPEVPSHAPSKTEEELLNELRNLGVEHTGSELPEVPQFNPSTPPRPVYTSSPQGAPHPSGHQAVPVGFSSVAQDYHQVVQHNKQKDSKNPRVALFS